jgi:hypothetical protein
MVNKHQEGEKKWRIQAIVIKLLGKNELAAEKGGL